jgi:N-acetylmuramate 1-kinase
MTGEEIECWSAFVRLCLPSSGEPEFHPLYGDASARRFIRVQGLRRPAVLMVNPDPPADPRGVDENDSYVYLAGILRSAGGLPPDIYGFDRARGLILMEDVGDRLLQDEVQLWGGNSEWTAEIYRRLLALLVRLQTEGGSLFDDSRIFNRAYDADFMYRAEGLYFAGFFVERLCGLKAEGLRPELRRLADKAGKAATQEVLIYRDFQSRNVMLGPNDEFRLLDFQGARSGPPAYDVASLLYDPYIELPDELREKLALHYRRLLAGYSSSLAAEFSAQFPLIAVHRQMQVLGAYAKLYLADSKSQYLRYIPAALANLRKTLQRREFEEFPVLRETAEAAVWSENGNDT